jgi:hypothetical protein
MSGRICTDNGIRHLLTAPYSPTTTGKAGGCEAMRAEVFTGAEGMFATVAELQAALGGGLQHRPAAPVVWRPPAGRAVPARRPVHLRGRR